MSVLTAPKKMDQNVLEACGYVAEWAAHKMSVLTAQTEMEQNIFVVFRKDYVARS